MTEEEYEEEGYDEEEDEWEPTPWGDDRPLAPTGSLSLAYLATLPLFAAYEFGRASTEGTLRNTSELFVGRPLALLGQHEDAARLLLLAALALAAFVQVRRRGWRLGHSVLRTWAEGLAGAILLGPMVVLGLHGLGDKVAEIGLRSGPPAHVPDLERAALVFGAAAWEELLFRVGLYSLLYLLARRTASFFGAHQVVARWTGEGVGLVGSSLFFAAVHLDVVVRLLGSGGEPFHSGLFAWRALAGLCLGILYRWRGAGVAAWSHGLFNLALLLGAGPAVFV